MDHEFEWMTKEEEAQFDAVLEGIAELIAVDADKVKIINPMKMQQFQLCVAIAKQITNGTGISVSYEVNKPFLSSAYISFEGTKLKFTDAKWFARISEFASNMEAYPLVNGRVRVTFTFHGLVNVVR